MYEIKRELLFNIFKSFSENQFFISENRTWTFWEFLEETLRYSEFLDIKPYKKVPILTENTEFFLKSILALWLNKAIAVPLNPNYPISKKKELLFKVGCIESSYEELLMNFKKASEKNKISYIKRSHNKKYLSLKFYKKNLCVNTRTWATIIFTSGSSGTEKAVVHSLANHFYNALGSNTFSPLNPGDRWFISLPLYHVGGLAILFRILLSGAAMVSLSGKYSIHEIINNYRISHLSLVPTQLYRLLKSKSAQNSLKKLKLILLGGANIPENLIKKSLDLGLKIKTTYGSTEMASQIATGEIDSYKILPHREMKISKTREIEVRGKTRFIGYLEDGELFRPFDKNGWFKTGDLGFWNFKTKKKENFFFEDSLKIIGRKDGMIISGGENILPEEIEKVIFQSKMVEHAIVVSVEDIEFGMRPVVFIKYFQNFSESKLRNFLEKHLIKFKIPDLFLPWDDTFESNFKFSKKELKKIAQYQFDILKKTISK